MQEILNAINGWVWDGIGLWMLLGSGVWLTCRNGFFQFRRCRLWLGQVGKGIFRRGPADKPNVSPFQALCTTLAATLGVGNIVGVAAAVTAGGPGSVFWMWIAALLGMMTGYAEKVLGSERYNCAEYKNEGYLFAPYGEKYYKGLSKYITKEWKKYR